MICTSLFATTSVNSAGADGAFFGNPLLLGKTLLVLVIIVPWFFTFTWGCLWVTNKIMSLRVTGACCGTATAALLRSMRNMAAGPAAAVIALPLDWELVFCSADAWQASA